ncbi:hypothetical protein BN7_5766 [Wickerhamomyces ciferrii]|uniref:CUE domain-containing protein n=1 Tax=Wickerhamomyces ciferrii (strain ATCC 14091 / BCRC 22168 / CBS 111 / JCM 3599 / NBRC 0793 / NRRL Y-1031 F-60-10) TaxID=1206466 RepID=K0KW21_WICCF|nr:uncharacterized protein BN7_5766 [Wickerhamomyces ciferrii]CCH46177.1 hypothetical protein BN7_5766 [Wickerhamomyces ciferrii]
MSDIEEEQYVELPIVNFPPFKLRSSMVDKDPVIWVHLIEVYINYIQTILQLKVQISPKSEQQLCLFVKSYLHEIAEEQGQILSLGLINVQITQNLDILRSWILELIKQYGVLNLKLNGGALWDFAKIYSLKNTSTVRGIIDGTLKPKDKKSINSISLVHKHIDSIISNGKFDKIDLQTLATLLENKSKSSPSSSSSSQKAPKKPQNKIAKAKKTASFSETFVTVPFIENLEKLYANEEGRFAKTAKDIAVLSLISIPISKVASIGTELGVNTLQSLSLYPLFGGIIASSSFHLLNPGIEQRFPFLIKKPKPDVKEDDINTLIDLFPDLTISHTEKLLKKYKNNVEEVTNLLLEHPEAAIEKEEEITRHTMGGSNLEKDKVMGKKVLGKKSSNTYHVPDEHKNRTLTAALKLMYESDEDEHDDTYDEAEAVQNDGEKSKYDKIEKTLWEIFKKDPSVFEKSNRKSRSKQELVKETGWSHEQIEGWARMLQKQPKRVKILESKYMFRGNKPQRSFRSEQDEEIEEERRGPSTNNKQSQKKPPQQQAQGNNSNPQNVKKQQARNEKNKSSRANHNRKSGHDKKMAKGM